jgi:hypothetical protein
MNQPVVGADAPGAEQLLLAERDPATGRLVQPRLTGGRNGKGRSKVRPRWLTVGVPVLVVLLLAGVGTAVLAGGGGGGDDDGATVAVPTTVTDEPVDLSGAWKIKWEFVKARNPISPTPLEEPPGTRRARWDFKGPCDGVGRCTLVDAAGNKLPLRPSDGGYAWNDTGTEVPPSCITSQSVPHSMRMTLTVTDGVLSGRWVGGPDVWSIVGDDGSTCYLFETTFTITGRPARSGAGAA